MFNRKLSKYGKPVRIIHAGEYYISAGDEFIGTLLGSCVAVCLHDPEHHLSGMNHFMLPGRISKADIFQDRTARYGVTAMNNLLDEMISRGARKELLIAKIFGGGSVLDLERKTNTIPVDNVRLAWVLLEMEDIPVAETDTGGIYTRKLMMDVHSGKVYLRRSRNRRVFERVSSEQFKFVKRDLQQ
jgi:chemotaxis protein CheD